MARRGSLGRLCYLSVFMTLIVVMYQHHASMQLEINYNRTSRDKFEKMYDEALNNEKDWRLKYDSEKQKNSDLSALIKTMKNKARDEVERKQILETQKSGLEMELDVEKRENLKLQEELKITQLQLEKAEGKVKSVQDEKTKLAAKISLQNDKVESVNKEKEELQEELSNVKAQLNGLHKTSHSQEHLSRQHDQEEEESEESEPAVEDEAEPAPNESRQTSSLSEGDEKEETERNVKGNLRVEEHPSHTSSLNPIEKIAERARKAAKLSTFKHKVFPRKKKKQLVHSN